MNSLEARRSRSAQILRQYPGRYPVIIHPATKINTPIISRHNFIVYGAQNFYALVRTIRPYIQELDDVQTLFFFINDAIIPSHNLMVSTLYDRYAAEDGYLYLTYIVENSFG